LPILDEGGSDISGSPFLLRNIYLRDIWHLRHIENRPGTHVSFVRLTSSAYAPEPQAALSTSWPISWSAAMNVMTKAKPFTLPPLPYEEAALAPTISANTMSFHYGKHHKAYVDKLNTLVAGTQYADMGLEDIVKASFKDPSKREIFNNAGQAWNHTFFWTCLTPHQTKPGGEMLRGIERDFGSLPAFNEEFAKHGVSQFGSGWVWLVADAQKLSIEKTSNAETPMAEGKRCLLTIDVWEHAYYLDYQNRRPDFLKAVTEKLLNWDFATQNLERTA
jgi:Fe-Mn family superoxide dismutase